jgi:membrane-associated PAP2 superfamily phosphatase
MTPAEFWWRHTRAPLFWFLLLATLIAASGSDPRLAHALFFDPMQRRWIGAGSWWANEFFHTGGRWMIRAIAAFGVTVWIASSFNRNLRALRRPAAYFVLSLAASIAAVGLLKILTNVDCPWDLREFGGHYPYVELFADRPDLLRPGQCFPAAHASSGYALFALYFVIRERSRRWAKRGIALALLVGAAFGLAQQSRGAHFVSHDVWSAYLVWMTSLTIYACAFRARLWDPSDSVPTFAPARAAPDFDPASTAFDDPAVVRVRAGVEHGIRGPPRPPGQ